MEQSRVIPIDTLKRFAIEGEILEIEELKRGHINRTYVATWGSKRSRKRYVHQVVNHRIFRDIDALMSNLDLITTELRAAKKSGGLREDEVTLTLVRSTDDKTFLRDEQGEYWRTFEYLEATTTYDVCPSIDVARESAAILGRFQRCLLDLDPSLVKDTIPNFHHGGKRFEAFELAVKDDRMNRAKLCRGEIEFALERRAFASALIDNLSKGSITRRVCHNDMKLNNVLFDSAGARAVCLLDLDTCMPGSLLFDFGDLARNTAVPSAEDEQDLSKVVIDMDLYRAICEGYLAEMRLFLNREEIELMPIAPRVLALTLGVRFLTDYLSGDTYFRTHRPSHNLERARAQFQVVRMMEGLESRMSRVVSTLIAHPPGSTA